MPNQLLDKFCWMVLLFATCDDDDDDDNQLPPGFLLPRPRPLLRFPLSCCSMSCGDRYHPRQASVVRTRKPAPGKDNMCAWRRESSKTKKRSREDAFVEDTTNRGSQRHGEFAKTNLSCVSVGSSRFSLCHDYDEAC